MAHGPVNVPGIVSWEAEESLNELALRRNSTSIDADVAGTYDVSTETRNGTAVEVKVVARGTATITVNVAEGTSTLSPVTQT